MRSAALFAIGVLSASVVAQTNILPTSANGVAGTTSNQFPWGNAATFPGLRIMCLYDSTHFTNAPLPITTPILITSIKWRANDVGSASTWTGGTYSQASVSLGTAAVDYLAASPVFASNVGGDYMEAYRGPVSVLPGNGSGVGVPGPYVVSVALNEPFVYDPNLGDLVVDTEFLAGSWIGGTQVAMDVQATNVNARRIYATSMWPAANGVDTGVPVIEIGYVPATGTVAATRTPIGAGCIRQFASVYESFATAAAFDLVNHAVTFLPNGSGGYDVALQGGILPVGATATPASLALGDDSQVIQTFTVGSFPGWTAMTICSNCYISQASGNGTGFAPSAATMLNAAQAGFWCWHDYNPSLVGSGAVTYEESPSAIVVTWNGVWDFGGTSSANANNVQYQFYPSGVVTLAWGTMSGFGNGHLVGYSPGGVSMNPGSRDLSALGPNVLSLAAADVAPLALIDTSRPVLGTSWNLNVSNIPATGVLGIDVFGLADPGIDDLFFLGMPSCGLRSSLDSLGTFLVTGSVHAYSVAIPNAPSLVNVHLFTTSAVFQVPPVNAFGAITSNGIDGKLGDM